VLVKIHHCIGQELIIQGLAEPPAKKCRCRETISLAKATVLVDRGEAAWVIESRIYELGSIVCDLCQGDKTFKNCPNCRNTGKIEKIIPWPKFNNEIIRISRRPVDPNERKQSSGLAIKTPRVATIEEEHIQRAYVENKRAAQIRIEEYGDLEYERMVDAIILIPAEEFDREERESWGRPLETFGANQQAQKAYTKIVKSRTKADFGG
jgi:hypothetical protein